MKNILKFWTAFVILAVSSLALTSCNMNVGFGSYSFKYVHVQMYGSDPVHLKVKSWMSDEGGIELKTEDHGSILLGDGTYMLYDQEKCPLCGTVTYK